MSQGPWQPEHVWSRVHVANMLGTDSLQTGSASVAVVGWGGVLQAWAGNGRESEGCCWGQDP